MSTTLYMLYCDGNAMKRWTVAPSPDGDLVIQILNRDTEHGIPVINIMLP
jgi:hypothetical protein